MSVMTSQITSVSIVCSIICSGTDQRKHQSSASLAFVRGIHRWPVDSRHKGPVTWKMFPFDNVITDTNVSGQSPEYRYIYPGNTTKETGRIHNTHDFVPVNIAMKPRFSNGDSVLANVLFCVTLLVWRTGKIKTVHITVTSHGRHCVSSHWQLLCLFNSVFRLTTIKHQCSALLALYGGNPLVTGGYPSQKTYNAEGMYVSIFHQDAFLTQSIFMGWYVNYVYYYRHRIFRDVINDPHRKTTTKRPSFPGAMRIQRHGFLEHERLCYLPVCSIQHIYR